VLSIEYYYRFVMNPNNITKLFTYCFEKGLIGVQLLPYAFVAQALINASRRVGVNPIVVGTFIPEEPESFSWLTRLESKIVLLHANTVDSHDKDLVEGYLDMIVEHGMVPGVVTHEPLRTVPFIKALGSKVKVLMGPLNSRGIFMGDRDRAIDLYRELGLPMIAKKALGAGLISPGEALRFVLSFNFVKSVAVGVASEREVDELIVVIKELFES